MAARYEYEIYEQYKGNDGRIKNILKGRVGAGSPSQAIKKARLDQFTAIKTRKGAGYTNTMIMLYDIWYEGREKELADYVMKRIL